VTTRGKKATVLLGAGASVPYLKLNGESITTNLITQELTSNWDRWLAVWNQFEDTRQKMHDADSRCDYLGFNDLKSLVTRYADLLRDDIIFKPGNFEQLVHLLDKASSYLWYLGANRESEVKDIDSLLIGTVPGSFERAVKSFARETNLHGWNLAPWIAREVIASIILDAWKDASGIAGVGVNDHSEFLKRMHSEFESVNVYSLNYDPLAAEAAKMGPDYKTGFLGRSGKFEPSQFLMTGTACRIAFMHGHLGFGMKAGGNLVLDYDYRNAQESRIRWGALENEVVATFKGTSPKHAIITGLDKFDVFTRNPFAAYIHCFSQDVLDSDCVVIVGASMGDKHLNVFIHNVLRFSPKPRYVFVTWLDAESRSKGILPEKLLDFASITQDWVTARVSGNHGPGDAFTANTARFTESVAKKGYGQFQNRSIIYCLGSDDFFRTGSVKSILEEFNLA